jgi:hypothetical protein
MAKLDTKRESAGAEFLVLGRLLIEGIDAYQAYNNQRGYDLIAAHPERGTSLRIQVKSRYATDYDGGFPISNFDSDFVAFVALNRGIRYRRRSAAAQAKNDGKRPPTIWIVPTHLVEATMQTRAQRREEEGRATEPFDKVFIRDIDDLDRYTDAFALIAEALGAEPADEPPEGEDDVGTGEESDLSPIALADDEKA